MAGFRLIESPLPRLLHDPPWLVAPAVWSAPLRAVGLRRLPR